MNSRFIKQTFLKGLVILSGVSALAVSLSFAYYYATKTEFSYNMEGQVGLRNYFHTSASYVGDGTAEKPYVITRPIHFYNLTRLQNLGVFGTKTYFQLGYELDPTNQPGVYLVYKTDSSVDSDADPYSTYLDMSGDTYSSNLLSIGSESVPFYGQYDGKNIPVVGLTIHSSPEDVGVFGYVASQALVKNCIFSSLNVYNDGYNTNEMGYLYADDAATGAILSFTENGGTPTEIPSTGTAIYSQSAFTGGTFTAVFPTLSPDYEKSVKSSSSIVLPYENNVVSIDTAQFINDSATNTFMTTNHSEIDFRISLTASRTLNYVSYSKVLSSYLIKFINNFDTNDKPVITMKAYRDYVSGTEGTYTEYAHGNNVGYIVGHTDGSVQNCYVYNAKDQGGIHLNYGTASTYTHLKAESSIGLIGEVGVNILNGFSPSEMYEKSGDTGVINFTEMYNTIRGTAEATKGASNLADSKGNQYAYYTYKPQDSGLFDEFLRRDMTNFKYITNASNTLDYIGQQVISDTSTKDRGLGIFKLATANYDNKGYDGHPLATYYLDGFGSYNVSKVANKEFTEFYYTTAEYVPTDTTTNTPAVSESSVWTMDSNSISANKYRIEQQTHMPTYSDEYTWNSRYEKRINYIIKSPFSSSIKGNYFYNTNCDLLKNYFKYKLRDKKGEQIEPLDPDFGVMVRNVATDGTETNITSLDSYLSISAPGNDFSTITYDNNTYASSSIYCKVSNENGANITVMASNYGNTGRYVSLYKKEQSLAGAGKINQAALRPMYSTFIPGIGSDVDGFSYFTYNPDNGTTTTQSTIETNATERLFAHTFFVPQGEYFIACPSNSMKIYYVAAQGQLEGNTGENEVVYTDFDSVKYLDFLLYDPRETLVASTENTKAGIYTEVYFTSASTLYQVYTDANAVLHVTLNDSLINAVVLNSKYTSNSYYFGDTLVSRKKYYFYPNV